MKIVSIYEYDSYKKFVSDWLKTQNNKGRGFYTRLADRLGTTTAAISQVFSDDRNLTLEQTIETTELMNLSEPESYFFLLLVETARAGSAKLKIQINSRINQERKRQESLAIKLPKDADLSDATRAEFYSSWVYSGLRNFMALEKPVTLTALSKRFNIDEPQIKEVLNFLISHNLLIENSGKIKVGPQKTHLPRSSPWAKNHHQNWRVKAIETMKNNREKDLFYTGPMSLSENVAEEITRLIPEMIKQIVDKVGPSKSETVRCLNIDWFQY